ncbi:MAG: urease accessory protein UreD [Segetibacter sp.]|jgi:urease accessory protein|nr:urease accessory protein UreD [Segetibacter sp.]
MIAKLHIKAALREGKTFLKRSFFTHPFKLANVTEDKSQNQLQLMLMSSSPGVLDGDEYEIKIELEEGCSLQLQTQSYQRLFTMKKGASQNMEVNMCKGSSFCYLPHPAVPHKASDFVAANKINLSDNCTLTWGEIVTCGRKLSGEEFQFTRFQNHTEIFLNGRLVVKENLLIKPSAINVMAIGQLEGYTHQASLIFIDEGAAVNELISKINDTLIGVESICFGVSALSVKGVIIRLLGYKGEQLYNCLQLISRFLPAKAFV